MEKKKRGDLQLIALELINALPEDYVFEDLTAAVSAKTGHDEAGARHLVRYLAYYQDRLAVGKTKTLREQGRIIQPSWYTPVLNTNQHYTDGDGHKRGSGKPVLYEDFKFKSPSTRKKAEPRSKLDVKEKIPTTMDAIKIAARNFNAKKAAAAMTKMAKEGAHHFSGTTVVPKAEPEVTASVETEEA